MKTETKTCEWCEGNGGPLGCEMCGEGRQEAVDRLNRVNQVYEYHDGTLVHTRHSKGETLLVFLMEDDTTEVVKVR